MSRNGGVNDAHHQPQAQRLYQLYQEQQRREQQGRGNQDGNSRGGPHHHGRGRGRGRGRGHGQGANSRRGDSRGLGRYPSLDTRLFDTGRDPHELRDAFAVAQQWSKAIQKFISSTWDHGMQPARVMKVLKAAPASLTGGTLFKLRKAACNVYLELLRRDVVYAHRVARVRYRKCECLARSRLPWESVVVGQGLAA